MTEQEIERFVTQAGDLAKAYRAQCLWFAPTDFLPRTAAEAQHVLVCIEKYGDRAGFEEVQRLRQWLSQHSNAISAG